MYATMCCVVLCCAAPNAVSYLVTSHSAGVRLVVLTVAGGKDHHPGRLGHRLRGHNLAFFLLHILRDAIRDLRTVLQKHSQEQSQAQARNDKGQTVRHLQAEIVSKQEERRQRRGGRASTGPDSTTVRHLRPFSHEGKVASATESIKSSHSRSGAKVLNKESAAMPTSAAAAAVAAAQHSVDSARVLLQRELSSSSSSATAAVTSRDGMTAASILQSMQAVLQLHSVPVLPGNSSLPAGVETPLFSPADLTSSTSSFGTSNGKVAASRTDTISSGNHGSSSDSSGGLNRMPHTGEIYSLIVNYLQSVYQIPLPPVPSAYNIPEISYKPTCHTDFEPRVMNSLQDIIVRQYSNWQKDLAFLDKAAVEKSDARGLGYIDKKYVFTSTGVNSSLSFVVRNTGANRVWLAELQKGFQTYPADSHADLNHGADVFVQLNYKSPQLPAQDQNQLQHQQLPMQFGGHSPDLNKMTKISKIGACLSPPFIKL